MSGIGPKLQQVIDLRLRRYEERGPGRKKQPTEAARASKPINAPVTASAPQQETTTMKKAKKTKAKKRALHPAIKSVTSTGHKTTEIKIGRSEAASNLKKAKAAGKTKPVKSEMPTAPAGGVRPGSKLEIVVGLLTRPEGCTAADAIAGTGWPTLSFPQQAKAAGLTLRKEKQGKVTRYWGTPAAA